MSTLWDSASENILKPLSSLHRRAIKLVLLKSSSLSFADYAFLDILPFKLKLKYNKAVFMFKILSGGAPPSLINKFRSNKNRHIHKLMLPLPRIDIFKSSLTYSGGLLWNNISTTLTLQINITKFKRMYHSELMTEFAKTVL